MRYKRVFIQNSCVHIVATTYKRQNILIEHIALLRAAFKNAKKYFDFEIISVCILPDHFHLIIKPKDINEYPKIITSIKYHFSKRFTNVGVETPTYGYKNKGEKGIWQKRYWEHTIIDEADLNNHLNYIHYNPVKHGLAKHVKDWEHSTFHKFVEQKNYDIDWGSAKDVEQIKELEYE